MREIKHKGFLLGALMVFVMLLFQDECSGQTGYMSHEINEGDQEFYFLPFYYLPEIDEELSETQAIEKLRKGEFIFFDGNLSDLNPTTEKYWIYTKIKNNYNVDQQWLFDYGSNWAKVEHYLMDSSNNILSDAKLTGKHLPVNNRNFAIANKLYIQEVLHAGQEGEYLVHLNGENVKSYTFGAKSPAFFLFKKDLAIKRDNTKKFWIGVFSAIFGFMFIYHLFVYFSTWDKNYLYYLGLIATYFYLPLANSGYAVELMADFSWFPKIMDNITVIVSSLTGILTILFTRDLLAIPQNIPRWDKILKILLVIIVLQMVGQFFFARLFSPLIPIMIIFQMISLISIAVISVIKKIPSARYYIIAYGFSIMGVILYSITVAGVLPFNEFNILYGPALGWALEILFFSFAIANIINVLKKQNEESQLKYISQLKENESLQIRLNKELENKVKERTKELENQKDLLEVEKAKSDELLLNILPGEIAEELKAKGYAAPKSYENVTVLFTDFKNFTNISSNLSSEDVVKNLDYCFKAFDDIISKYKLEKIKTIGDAYMCVGGLPHLDPMSPINTVQAAIEMRNFISDWNEEKTKLGLDQWHMRIGIHTGPVTAGIVGKKKFAFDIWGDTVNIASRMESAGIAGKINVSVETWKLIREYFEGMYRGPIKIKNHKEVNMYFVEDRLN